MIPFLEEVSRRIINESRSELEQICIVLPNRRAGLFLKKQLAKQIKKPFFPPQITSIEDFILKLTGLQTEDTVYLLFSLYQIHKELEGGRMLHFNEFVRFGEMLLHDFNDIDLHLADAKAIFTWLSEEKAISLWNVNGQELTPNQKSYLQFYSLIYSYYERLNILCAERDKSYHGRIYRIAAENIESLAKNLEVRKIWIVGFNALTKSEYRIFQYLERSRIAEIIWDADKYYMESDIQEAGLFLRNYVPEFKTLNNFSDCFKEAKKIDIIGASENVLQAKYVGQEIKKLIANDINEETLENTTIVLADENLLLPVLNSLPSDLPLVNITMGYPFYLTPMYDLSEKLLQLHVSKNSAGNFNRQALLTFLSHPYWQRILLPANLKPILLEKLSDINKPYVSVGEIQQLCKNAGINFKIISLFFKSDANALDIIEMFNSLISLLWAEMERNILEKEYLYTFYKLNIHLKEIQSFYNPFDSNENLQTVYISLASRINIPFYGEPLRGLQVMGLLETRVIDFENVIVLSVNEGILPKGKTNNSLLPFQIKKYFGIPSYNESDAIYAYHYYRLLQRAKNITLLYNTDTEGFGKSEKSRFIKQLQLELKHYSPQTEITERLLTATENPEIEDNTIYAKKSEVVIDRLKIIAEGKGFSPTSLNCYIRCPLQFYFTHMLKIPETKELEETIDNAILGTVIHAVLEYLFSPANYPEGYIQSLILSELETHVNELLTKTFEKEYPQGNLHTGKNKLIFEIAQKIITSFIKKQQSLADNARLEIVGLETELRSELKIETPDGLKIINLSGKTDRIERLNNILTIIDYKSGYVSDTDLKVKSDDLENFNLNKIPEKSFQLLLYLWLYAQKNEKGYETTYAGIYSFRRIDDGLLTVKIDNNNEISKAEIDKFELFLARLLEEIFNKDIPFNQAENEKTCTYCPYISICGR